MKYSGGMEEDMDSYYEFLAEESYKINKKLREKKEEDKNSSHQIANSEYNEDRT